MWKRVNSTMLRFTCEVACRTEIIVGCAVTLTSGQIMLFGNSTNVKGNLRTFEPRLVMIDMPNINSDLQYSYSARALIVGSAVYPNSLGGFILPSTRKYDVFDIRKLKVILSFRTTIIGQAVLWLLPICQRTNQNFPACICTVCLADP